MADPTFTFEHPVELPDGTPEPNVTIRQAVNSTTIELAWYIDGALEFEPPKEIKFAGATYEIDTSSYELPGLEVKVDYRQTLNYNRLFRIVSDVDELNTRFRPLVEMTVAPQGDTISYYQLTDANFQGKLVFVSRRVAGTEWPLDDRYTGNNDIAWLERGEIWTDIMSSSMMEADQWLECVAVLNNYQLGVIVNTAGDDFELISIPDFDEDDDKTIEIKPEHAETIKWQKANEDVDARFIRQRFLGKSANEEDPDSLTRNNYQEDAAKDSDDYWSTDDIVDNASMAVAELQLQFERLRQDKYRVNITMPPTLDFPPYTKFKHGDTWYYAAEITTTWPGGTTKPTTQLKGIGIHTGDEDPAWKQKLYVYIPPR